MQIEEITADKENASKQMQSLRTDTAHMRLKQQKIDKEATKEMPVNKVRAGMHGMHWRTYGCLVSSAHAARSLTARCSGASCLQGLFSLYHNISKIRWDGECTGPFQSVGETHPPTRCTTHLQEGHSSKT